MHIAIQRSDGVSIMNLPGNPSSEAIARAVKKWESVHGAALSYRIIDPELLPSRRFRNCWEMQGATLTVNLVRAKEQVLAEVKRQGEQRSDKSAAQKAARELKAQNQIQRLSLQELETYSIDWE